MKGETEFKVSEIHTIVQAKISKIKFPEVCPVCMNEAEDLVPVSIIETTVDRWTERRGLVSGWARETTSADEAITSSQGGTTFWVPTCLAHGSDTVTTPQKKIISIIGFMLLFYPLLFYALGLTAAIQYSRPILEVFVPFVLIFIAIIIVIMYGFYPRALERNIRFLSVDRAKDEVIIALKNDEYRDVFLELNGIAAKPLQGESTKTSKS